MNTDCRFDRANKAKRYNEEENQQQTYLESMYKALMDLLQSGVHSEVVRVLHCHDISMGEIMSYILSKKEERNETILS